MRPTPLVWRLCWAIFLLLEMAPLHADNKTQNFGRRFLPHTNCTHKGTCENTNRMHRIRRTILAPDSLNVCENIGFELNTFEGWTGRFGSGGQLQEEGIILGRHSIINTGNDELVPELSRVAPGSQYSVRLGNSGTNYEIDQLSTSFLVSESNTLFSYQFAVVLQDPGHDPASQPKFEIAAYDENGQIIPCGYYLVVAAADIDGFESRGQIRWRDWSTVGIDLSDYIGQAITITFTTVDCAQGAHFGYAYIDAECLVAELTIDCNDPEVCEDGASYCPGASSIVLNAPDGFTNYEWSTGQTGRNIVVDDPEPGDIFSVSFNNFTSVTFDTCVIELSIEIPDGAPPEILMADTLFFCEGGSVEVDLGDEITSVNWSTGETTPSIQIDEAGYYSVTYEYNGGCEGEGDINVVEGEPPSFTIESTDPDCYNEMNGSIAIRMNTVNESTTYDWNTGDINNELTNLGPGTYCVTISNRASCTVEECFELINPPLLEGRTSWDDNLCHGDQNGIIELLGMGGTPPYAYTFNDEPFQTENFFDQLPAGNYQVRMQDARGCEWFEEIEITEPGPLFVDAGEDRYIDLGETVQLEATPSYQVAEYIWEGDTALDCINCPVSTTRPFNTGNYAVEVRDSNGCVAMDELIVYVNKEYDLYIPNGFSPDGDGINDQFFIFAGEDVTQIKSFAIYTRWGELVMQDGNFLPNDSNHGWDGTHKGRLLDPGVFVYHATIEFIDGAVKHFKGDVTLVR